MSRIIWIVIGAIGVIIIIIAIYYVTTKASAAKKKAELKAKQLQFESGSGGIVALFSGVF